jgi:hypothetical protein
LGEEYIPDKEIERRKLMINQIKNSTRTVKKGKSLTRELNED